MGEGREVYVKSNTGAVYLVEILLTIFKDLKEAYYV